MMRAHAYRWLALGFAIVLVFAAGGTAMAQTETGRISGIITDATGGVLPGVAVTLKSDTTGSVRSSVTDASGRYVFANVAPGPYELTAELSGFQVTRNKAVVTVGTAMSLDLKLQIAGAAETVTVTGESPVVNTANSEVATVINETQIRELPTLTRNVYDLVGVAGNVATDTTSGRGTGYAINGMRSASTNVLLDGSANNDEFSATVGQSVPLDSVQEFSVVTSNFSAQYGRAAGGIVNVATKSGSNQFRGTGYEFFRNEKLATNTPDNIANNIEKGKFNRSQMGYSLGGPVKKDKVLFFSSLEYIRVRSFDTQISWVPTPQFIGASAAATQTFFNTYGKNVSPTGEVLTRDQVSAIVGTDAGAFNSLPGSLPVFAKVTKSLPRDAGGGDPQDNYQLVNRVDWNISANSQFYVRWAYQSQVAQAGTNASSPYGGYDTGYLSKNHNLLGSFTHVFSPVFTSQTKFVWNRLFNDQPLNGDPLPTLYMNPTTAIRLQGYRIAFPGYLPWSPGSAIPFGGPQQLFQVYQDQTWIKGKHDFRFGGSFVRMLDDRTFGAYENSVEALNQTSAALPSLNNFVLGQLAQFQTSINPGGYPGGTYTTPVPLPSFTSYNRYNEFALYAQDNWSISRKVTLNLGLRYEYFGPQTKSKPKYDSNFYWGDQNLNLETATPQQVIDSVRDGKVLPSNESPIGALWKSDWNNFAPRIGFAWNVTGDGKTSIRGGYGIGYERNFGNVTYNVLFNPPQYLVASINAPADVATMPVYTDLQGPFGGIAGVQKTIPRGSLRHVDPNIVTAYAHFYSASFQRELSSGVYANVEYTGSSGRKLYDLADVNKPGAGLVYEGVGGVFDRPNSQYTAFNTRGNRGRSQYHGVTLGLDARRLGDTGLSAMAQYTYSTAKDNLSSTFSDSAANYNLGYLDAFDPMLDWGYAEYDVRHRLSLSGIWTLPLARNASGARRAALGDWQVNFIFSARTGYPFTLWDCTSGYYYCMRAEDPVGIGRTVGKGVATGNPNEYTLIDLSRLVPYAGTYVNPVTDTSDFGPYPADMTTRDAFRGPANWNVDLALSKRIRFGGTRAVQARVEFYNLFNHHNMYVNASAADISSYSTITGALGDSRRIQLGVKFEF
jgi:outer membrane receptor protein involved in Fe transport